MAMFTQPTAPTNFSSAQHAADWAKGSFSPNAQPFTTSPAAPASTQGSITTSVTPGNVFTPNQTQLAQNQSLATASQNADPRWQQKSFMTPGRSTDGGTLAAATPGIAQSLFAGQQAAAAQPVQDAFANQNQMLQGQIAQQGESNGLANALAQINENNIYQRNQLMQPSLNLLSQYMGSLFGG